MKEKKQLMINLPDKYSDPNNENLFSTKEIEQQLEKLKEENNQSLIQLQEERATSSRLKEHINELQLKIIELEAKHASFDIQKDVAISLMLTLRYIQ